MTNTHGLLLGIVQGLTEFLPVSSSGHLVLFQQYLGLGENMLNFDIFVHTGTLLSVLVVFRSAILTMIGGSITDIRACIGGRQSIGDCLKESREIRLVLAIVIGTIPAAVIGFTLKDSIERLFSAPLPVLAALFVTGIVLIATFFVRRGEKNIAITFGLIVGLAQAMAIIPGISRSGMTIAAALFLGVKREKAGEFSFLLSVPAVAGATLLAVSDVLGQGFIPGDLLPDMIGLLVSFATGCLSLVVLMNIVKRGKIGYFGFYCLAVVLAGVILYGTGKIQRVKTKNDLSETVLAEDIVTIPSTYDGALQHVRFLEAAGKSRPLLVALHTWSYDYKQEDVCDEYFARARERDWHCIFPDFRGANNKPEACGSEAALRDILDAVAWAKETLDVDPRRVFLAGASGGGHMSLHVAGFSPSTWTAVSAWVPISDLARWHEETTERKLAYAGHIELVCGGPPGASPEVDAEYRKRSPLTSLWRANIIPMDINAGIHDGHGGSYGGAGSVPVGQTIRAYNELVKAADKPSDIIPEDVIEIIEKDEHVPDYAVSEVSEDADYRRAIHLRRTSGLTRLTILEGGHEILYDAAFAWFERF